MAFNKLQPQTGGDASHLHGLHPAITAPVPRDRFRFIDLFAGIGGLRRGFERLGGRCVFTSEWNQLAVKTYKANFHDPQDHIFAGDITQVEACDIPEHEVLLAGFPCQPFSIAGVSKKNALGCLFAGERKKPAQSRPWQYVLSDSSHLAGRVGISQFALSNPRCTGLGSPAPGTHLHCGLPGRE